MKIAFASTIPHLAPLAVEVEGTSSEPEARKVALEHFAATGQPLAHRVIGSIDLKGAKLDGLQLEHCTLNGVVLTGASVRGAKFAYCDLIDAQAEGADFTASTLQVCNWQSANLKGATLEKAAVSGNMRDADLRNVQAANSNWSGTRTQGAKWEGANLAWAQVIGMEFYADIVTGKATGTGTPNERSALLYFNNLLASNLKSHEAAVAETKRWLATLDTQAA